MECDATHSLIERKLNGITLHLPSQLVEMVSHARMNPFPLQVHHIFHEYFLKYDSPDLLKYKSVRPGELTSLSILRKEIYFPLIDTSTILFGILNNKIYFTGKCVGDSTVNMLRCLQYLPNGEINFMVNFSDDYEILPHRK